MLRVSVVAVSSQDGPHAEKPPPRGTSLLAARTYPHAFGVMFPPPNNIDACPAVSCALYHNKDIKFLSGPLSQQVWVFDPGGGNQAVAVGSEPQRVSCKFRS